MVRDFQKPTDVDKTLEEEAYTLYKLRSSATFEPSHRELMITYPSKFMCFSPCRRCCPSVPARMFLSSGWGSQTIASN